MSKIDTKSWFKIKVAHGLNARNSASFRQKKAPAYWQRLLFA
jgi:hypothetical protein